MHEYIITPHLNGVTMKAPLEAGDIYHFNELTFMEEQASNHSDFVKIPEDESDVYIVLYAPLNSAACCTFK